MVSPLPAHRAAIVNLYNVLFNRAPDASGLMFWAQACADGVSMASVTQSFLSAAEGRLAYPVTQASAQFVASLYRSVFDREPDAGGLVFWTAALDAAGGAASMSARVALVEQLVGTAGQSLDTRPADLSDADYQLTRADRALFAHKADVGDYVVTLNIDDVVLATQVLALVSADPASVPIAKAFAAKLGVAPAPPGPPPAPPGPPPAPRWFITNADTLPAIVSKLADYTGSGATVNATGMALAKLEAVADGIAKIASHGIGGVLDLTLADYAGATLTTLSSKLALCATLQVTGTAAADTIALIARPRATTINAGDGDDVFGAVVDGDTPANTTIDARHAIHGGSGIDTLNLSVTGVVAAALNGATLTGIERVSVHVSAQSSAHFSAQADVREVVVSGNGSSTVDGLRSGATVVLNDTQGTGSHTVRYASGSIASLRLLEGAGADVITVDGASLTRLDLTQRGDENFVNALVLGSQIGTMNFFGEGDTAFDGLSGGVAGLSLTVTSTGSFELSRVTTLGLNIDGSASTGRLVLDLGQAAGAVKSGSGDDWLIVSATATLTGNGGADLFVMREGISQTATITQASLNAKMVTITDFSPGDHLKVEAAVNLAADPDAMPVSGVLQEVSVGGGNLLAATMDAAVQLRAMSAEVPYLGFVYQANSYILVDHDLDGLGAGDMLIQLTGLPDLAKISYRNDLLSMT